MEAYGATIKIEITTRDDDGTFCTVDGTLSGKPAEAFIHEAGGAILRALEASGTARMNRHPTPREAGLASNRKVLVEGAVARAASFSAGSYRE
jgi:hypothetical protein